MPLLALVVVIDGQALGLARCPVAASAAPSLCHVERLVLLAGKSVHPLGSASVCDCPTALLLVPVARGATWPGEGGRTLLVILVRPRLFADPVRRLHGAA